MDTKESSQKWANARIGHVRIPISYGCKHKRLNTLKEDVYHMSSIFNGGFEGFTLVLILFILLVIIACSCE